MYARFRAALPCSDQETKIRTRLAFNHGNGLYEGKRPIEIQCDPHLMPCDAQIRQSPFSRPDLSGRPNGMSSTNAIRCQTLPHRRSRFAW